MGIPLTKEDYELLCGYKPTQEEEEDMNQFSEEFHRRTKNVFNYSDKQLFGLCLIGSTLSLLTIFFLLN